MLGTPRTTERIVTRRLYNFANVPGNGSQPVNLARRVSVDGFQEVSFIVRAHTGVIGKGSTIQIQPLMDASTQEDPVGSFLTPIDGRSGFPVTFTLDDTAIFPLLITYNLPPTGPYMLLRVIGSQPAGPVVCNVTLSVDVVRKGGTRPMVPTDGRFRGYRW